MSRARNDTITAVPGIRVGHATDASAATGCTVVLCEEGAVAGVDVRGLAPGTRETDAIRPGRLVREAHGVLLTGGSAFGLDAAGGVMRYLEERGIGFGVGAVRVPIVPAAVIFDLGVGDACRRPDTAMGYAACEASTADPVQMGSLGAGTGATVGKARGCVGSPGGVGSSLASGPDGLIVGAVVAVNAVGNVVGPDGRVVAGARDAESGRFVDVSTRMSDVGIGANTTIGVVATNAALEPDGAGRVASMAHDGLSRAIRPAHTAYDGDTLFALATGAVDARVDAVGALAAAAVANAIVRAVEAASR
jgi:L-aminopeptidase/D-esterase-like protein